MSEDGKRARLARLGERIVDGALRRLGLFQWEFEDALEDLFWELEPIKGDTPLEQAAYILSHASRVLVFAGSGLSAESGIATFRGKGEGLYSYDELVAMTHRDTFETSPDEQLSWHQQWREIVERAEPNAGQLALARLSRRGDYGVATQNVDHLMERAAEAVGVELPVWHLHGELTRVRCHDCGHEFEDPRFDFTARTPCPRCGGRLRPGVVWFGEEPPARAMERAREMARRAEACLLLGTSGVVYPAAALPEIAKHQGALLIEINPEETALTPYCDVTLRVSAGEALPQLLAKVEERDRQRER